MPRAGRRRGRSAPTGRRGLGRGGRDLEPGLGGGGAWGWVVWLHSVPPLSLRLQPVDSTFRPRDETYQESLLFLGLVAAICLGLNLVFLAVYLVCVCCCRRDGAGQTKQRGSCCVTWTAVVAGLLCCAAVGVGFYGNSETNDGVYQLIYSLDNVNHTFSGIDALVSGTTQRMKVDLEQHLARLGEIFAARGDYIQTLRFTQQMADSIVAQLSVLPVWREATVQLTALSDQTSYVEYCRWLSYLLLFILDLVVCFVACLGLAKRSRCLLASMLCCGVLTLLLSWTSLAADTAAAVGTSDFCVAPDTFILNLTQGQISTEVTHYYLYCSQSASSPFQQALTTFQRSLTTMQIQVTGLLQVALPLYPTAERDLLGIQVLLSPVNPVPANASESNLHQLTALLDCRGLYKDYLDALTGVCYDGIEGLLYLGLFSLLAALAFSTMICAGPRAWKHCASRDRNYDDIDDGDPFNPQARRIAAHNPPRGQLHSFCSYSSGLGSQTSLHPPAQTISNAPVSEYMNQAVLFGGNPRYENVPLIGRGSPPPTYSPSMRATYLSVADEPLRHYGNDFPG
ncbi:LOW QUALITY PROTEIN: protein tweety homolog 2 [Tupaia chinensis]|uniref:LOW QUALITY PROTEIN: protein tweety homolog 2 n=1 Tax=Tupaia chinensis TaxID=246437 RepID=UPI00070405DB|nr:LOW QUALITY PROTEIN: protein tweety homolog 2 [Tupaia chinensis]